MQTLCFAAILEKNFEKLSRRSMNFVGVIRWVAPKLQERILLRAYWPTLFAIKQEKSTLSDKNISSDWESKQWCNLQYR
jgi:hypothetical protein